jgi:hypothetical protein
MRPIVFGTDPKSERKMIRWKKGKRDRPDFGNSNTARYAMKTSFARSSATTNSGLLG